MRLQAFLPVPYFLGRTGVFLHSFPKNLDLLPAIHDRSMDFSDTLADLLSGVDPEAQLHADTAGIVAVEIAFDKEKGSKIRRNIARLELVQGSGFGERELEIEPEEATFTTQDAKEMREAIVQRLLEKVRLFVDDVNGANPLRTTVYDLVSNAGHYTRGVNGNLRVRAQRLDLLGKSNKYGEFLEMTLGTEATRIADTISARHNRNKLPDVDKQAFIDKLARDVGEADKEALYFAILPGFSTSGDLGICAPVTTESNGMALFFLSQLARCTGAMSIFSGRAFLELGKNKIKWGEWKWQTISRTIDQSVPGTLVSINIRKDMLKLDSAVRALSLECAIGFWRENRELVDSFSLATFYSDPINTLERLYSSFLDYESESLFSEDRFKELKKAISRRDCTVECSDLEVVRARLLNASPRSKPLPEEFAILPMRDWAMPVEQKDKP